MRNIVLILFVTLSAFYGINVNASCSYNDKSSQRILANNVNFSLSYSIVDNNASFSLTITGLNDELYIEDESGKKYFDDLTITGLLPGKKYKYSIYSDKFAYCLFGPLMVRTVATPFFNSYYSDPLCSNHYGEGICNRWNSINMERTEFENAIKKIEAKPDVIIEPINNDNKTIYDYLIFIVLGVMSFSALGFWLIKRKKTGF